MQITLDIETIPSQLPGALAEVRSAIKAPATLKKAESIAAWFETEAAAAAEEAYRKQSLDSGLAGEIISIAIAANEGSNWVICRSQGESEKGLLTAFSAAVEATVAKGALKGPDGRVWPTGEPFFIGHNAAFDLGFIWRRCIVNGVHLPFKFPNPSSRAGQHYGCTMQLWAGFGKMVSLDSLCKTLGVPSSKDGGIDGSKVYDAWLDGEYDRIAQYNLRDTIATQTIWHRLNGGAA